MQMQQDPQEHMPERSELTQVEKDVLFLHGGEARYKSELPVAELNDVIRSAVRQLGKHLGREFYVVPDCTRYKDGILTIRITESDKIGGPYLADGWTEENRVRYNKIMDEGPWGLPYTPDPRSGWWVVNVAKLDE